MRLKDLIKCLGICLSEEIHDFEVKGITSDSRKVKDDFVFLAVKGTEFDGHKFIDNAFQQGAKAIIIQDIRYRINDNRKVNVIEVSDTRKALAQLLSQFYGQPSLNLKVVGITGTNGKTTVSYLIESILKTAGFNPAVIGTINYRFKNKIFKADNTTPGSEQLQTLLSQMQGEGVDYVVIEVSSHALDQDRVCAVKFSAAVFTNLSVDHLDYHRDIQSYFRAKSKLFSNLSENDFAILNSDDAKSGELVKLTKARVFSYGLYNNADINARDIDYNINGTEFTVDLRFLKKKILDALPEQIGFKTSLIGEYNIYNILAAVTFTVIQKIDTETIKEAIREFAGVPGRLERVPIRKKFYVFVDYAHTEDALRNVVMTLRPLCKGSLYVIFGCGGNRDKSKRPKMGKVVSELADFAIITTDNPRKEDPGQIINDIISGIDKQNFKVIMQRKDAIREALTLARKDDIILIAGKGHENCQIFKDKVIHFDDREIVRECLALEK